MTRVFSVVVFVTLLLLAGQSNPSLLPGEEYNGPGLNGASLRAMDAGAFAVEAVELAGGVLMSR